MIPSQTSGIGSRNSENSKLSRMSIALCTEFMIAIQGECLYIGEAKWLLGRLNDHYNTRSGSQIKAFVSRDDGIDIGANNVWERTEIKYVSEVVGGKSGRLAVESALIERENPRYNTNR